MFICRAVRPLLRGGRMLSTSVSRLSAPISSATPTTTAEVTGISHAEKAVSTGTLIDRDNHHLNHAGDQESHLLKAEKINKPRRKRFSGSLESAETNKQVIARVLGLSPQDVRKIPPKLIDEDGANEVFHILQEEGFGKGQVLEHPNVFMLTSSSVRNYIEIMKESQFTTISLSMLINFRNIHKQGLKSLQEKNIAPTRAELVKNYCRILTQDSGSLENELWKALPKNTDRLSLAELRKYTIATYVARDLDEGVKEISKSIAKYPRLEYRCLKWVQRILDLLRTKELDFNREKILKHLYLLHGNATNMAKIVKEIKTLSGIPFKELAHSRPKVLMSMCSTLLDIETCFKEHKIPQTSIVKYPEIFTLSAKTVRKRLEELDEIPEFVPLKSHPRVVRLLYYQNKAKARIEHFRSLDISGASLHLLSADTKRYKNLLALGEMKNRGSDVVNFLSNYLGPKWSRREVRANLMRHPHWLHSTVVTVKESLQFIDSFHVFSKDQVFSALPLVLYPKEKIEKEFENVVIFKEAEISDEWFLHMVLYFLERFVHFSGDAIWNLKVNLRDEDDRETAVDPYSDSDSEESD